MTSISILDQFVGTRGNDFCPHTVAELLALRLAQKLDDAAAVAHYAHVLGETSEERVLYALKRAITAPGSNSLAERFRELMRKRNGQISSTPDIRTAAFKCERRSVAVAVFSGDQLDYTQVRQLSSSPDRATASVAGFVNFVVANLDIESAGIESSTVGTGVRRSHLTDGVVATLRQNSVPIWQVNKRELFDSFAYPALKNRKELRAVVRSIWPALGAGNGKNQILDAAAVGMFVQIERRFIFNPDLT
jgi:hypothetical protein